MNTCAAPSRPIATGLPVSLGVEIVVNVVLPLIVYMTTVARLGDAGALIASSAPPVAWSLIELARRRRIDALSLLTVIGIALALLALLGGGSPKWLQLREKLPTGLIGLVLVGSVLIGKPLMAWVIEAGASRAPADRVARLREVQALPIWPAAARTITLVWGLGLLADIAASTALIFSMPVGAYLVVGPLFGYAVLGLLSGWTWLYAKRRGLN